MRDFLNYGGLIAMMLFASTNAEVRGELLLFESFDYGPQDNSTKFLRGANDHNGGTGWSDEWKSATGDGETTGGLRLDLTETSISYPATTSLSSTGGQILNDFSAGSSQRSLTDSINLGAGGDLYFSSLVNWTTGAAFRAEFVRSSDGIVRWTPFDIDASGNVATGVVGTNSTGALSLTSDVDYLLVGKLERNFSGTTDRVFLSAFDVSSPGSFLTEPISWDLTDSDISGVALDSFRLTSDNLNVATIDEIRLGTTYADVVGTSAAVPEPSSLTMLGLALGSQCLLRRRRRHRIQA